jgi:hypothetical protein
MDVGPIGGAEQRVAYAPGGQGDAWAKHVDDGAGEQRGHGEEGIEDCATIVVGSGVYLSTST